MDNRRNFYRILRVQPDASHEVIQQSYRSLMQKLRLHPDLGGEHRNAGIINQAYATLHNPGKRAVYDIMLLGRYNIRTLSLGSVFSGYQDAKDQKKATRRDSNQRNYYRILQVQPDAELEIIKASYRSLSGQSTDKNQSLLDEAFYVVGDARRRVQYDTLLRLHTHAASTEKLKSVERLYRQSDGNTKAIFSATESGDTLESKQGTAKSVAYQAIIKHYCKFCQIPYATEDFMEHERFCRECISPLFSPADNFINAPRRSLPRMQQSESANIYEYWPGNPIQVSLEDLSPTGVNFSTPQLLYINQIIKVDASHFKAVAEVVYCRRANSMNSIGASFLTVEFLRATGSFLSTSA